MNVHINCLVEEISFSKALTETLATTVKSLLADNDLDGGEVGLILVDDQYIRSLNKQYRGRDAPTDVLSFSFLEPLNENKPGEGEFAIGDIYISAERAREQAADAGHSLEKEIVMLAVHGLLHLFGYEHEKEEDLEIMQSKERDILDSIDL